MDILITAKGAAVRSVMAGDLTVEEQALLKRVISLEAKLLETGADLATAKQSLSEAMLRNKRCIKQSTDIDID